MRVMPLNTRREQKVLKLHDVWRTCNKIRAAVFRVGLDLWEYYKPLDPDKRCLISEPKFISILAGPLKSIIGLSDKEICDLTDYFRIQDGRILYSQFCEVIHDSVPDFGKNKSLVTGLEWEDLLHVNALSGIETRKLNLIITQIAVLVSKRKIVLRPYFQDYELIAKNVGTVTLAHFGRILKFLGIVLGAEEFRLLVKRFAKDAYTVNYVAFLKAVDEVQRYLDEHGMVDFGGELPEQFPGRIITAELPKVPRPEIGKITPSQVFGKQTVFHPVTEPTRKTMPTPEVVKRIQRHILERRIRVHEFFKGFEYLNSGRVTVQQFQRALDALQISSLGHLWLLEPEVDALIALYKDPDDPDRVCWRTFQDDIDQVFTVKKLDKSPNLKVESPPQEIAELPRIGTLNWQCQPKSVRDLCEDILQRVRRRVEERRILLKQFFKDYDKHNCGHVTRAQLRQVLITATILLSPEEAFALEQRPDFIEYTKFAAVVEEAVATAGLEKFPLVVPLQHVPSEASDRTFLNFDERQKVGIAMDKLCQVRSPNLEEIFKDYDKENTGTVCKGHLIRTLSVRRMLELVNNRELDAVHKCFSIERSGRLEFNYRAFLRALHLLQENKKVMPF
ncbi:uncharacterized protein LOC105829378 isoform X6 [Monomorium pharaonis]|uniref:uncharacterized protein LOC105829378 isoform X6 n=1 Tax=Monomorium pharaonis TaxID=307658 RepID=UPI0017477031|nr:uncharacterized protein LOC105829378 isoform X6 [Monomorium pharaonis]